MRIHRWISLTMLMALFAGLAVSAGVSAQDATPTSQESFPVQIRFLNAMTAQKSIDVFINGSDKDQRVVEGLEYGTFSEYFEGTAPATGIIVKNNVNYGVDKWLFDVAMASEPGRSYVIVISDFIVISSIVDTSVPTDAGARGILVHAASQAPAVDVYVNDELTNFDLKYGRSGYGKAAAPGTYDARLTLTGTQTVALEQSFVVEAGKFYTYVIIGEPGSTEEPLTIVVAEDALVAA